MQALKAKKAMTSMQGKAQGIAQNIRQPVQDWRNNMMGDWAPGGGAAGAAGGAPAPMPVVGGGAPVPQVGQAGWSNPNTAQGGAPGAGVAGFSGNNAQGAFQNKWTPEFLKSSPVGHMQQQLLQSLMAGDASSRQFLNQDLANIRSSTQQAQDAFAGNARFRGSGVGAAVGQAMGQGGIATESRRLAQADQEELQRKLAISQGMSQGFTNPLMNSLGLAQQGFQGMSNRAMQEGMQPSGFEKGVGMVTGLVGAFMCWVAREVLRDARWLDARTALIQDGSPRLVSLYAENGEALAERVKSDPALRAELTPVFETMAERGKQIRLDREGE
jgi:hypothetical protein